MHGACRARNHRMCAGCHPTTEWVHDTLARADGQAFGFSGTVLIWWVLPLRHPIRPRPQASARLRHFLALRARSPQAALSASSASGGWGPCGAIAPQDFPASEDRAGRVPWLRVTHQMRTRPIFRQWVSVAPSAGGMGFAMPRMQILRAPALDGGQTNLLSGERTHATGERSQSAHYRFSN